MKNRDRSYDITSIFLQMELELIVLLKNNMKRHQELEEKEDFEYEQWAELKLRDLERFRKNTTYVLDKYEDDIENLIKETLLESYKTSRKAFNNTIGIIEPTIPGITEDLSKLEKIDIELEFFRINDDKLDSLVKTVNTDIDNAILSVQRRMDDVYRQTLFKTQVEFNTGHVTLSEAVDRATKDFLAKGVDSITYKDGKKVNITAYIDMALRTANHRAYLMGEGKKRQEFGISLVVVSAHANACEDCIPWQGKILIDDIYSGGTKEDGPYPLLSEAVKKGLLHPSCRHNLSTYFKGITTLPKVPDLETIEDNYKSEQQQRYIERMIRKYKRLEIGSTNELNQKVNGQKVKDWQRVMREHLKDNPQLRRNYKREKIY